MSARRIHARYEGRCATCSGTIHIGQSIVWLPPKGHRRRGRAIHDACAKRHGEKAFPTRPGAWRQNREWMTAEQFAMVEEAMRRMRPPT